MKAYFRCQLVLGPRLARLVSSTGCCNCYLPTATSSGGGVVTTARAFSTSRHFYTDSPIDSPSKFEPPNVIKRLFVLTRIFKRMEDVPASMTQVQITKLRDVARVRLMLASIIITFLMLVGSFHLYQRKNAGTGNSLAQRSLDRYSSIRQQHSNEK